MTKVTTLYLDDEAEALWKKVPHGQRAAFVKQALKDAAAKTDGVEPEQSFQVTEQPSQHSANSQENSGHGTGKTGTTGEQYSVVEDTQNKTR